MRQANDQATEIGRWRAAAILASGLRSLFVRPEAVLLLDGIYSGSRRTQEGTGAYWRKVAQYCIDGGLQAVLDEYIHHLAGDSASNTTTDEGLMSLALTARRAIALRESVYRATDIDHFDEQGIAFPSRYALRYGSTQHSNDEARLPEVRAAFNSPFWPFVLATTSIGQEGVDFHWWCHTIVHWNLPGNPVDFEQREGRVDRYKGTRSARTWRPPTEGRHWFPPSRTPGLPFLKPQQRKMTGRWAASRPSGFILVMPGYNGEL